MPVLWCHIGPGCICSSPCDAHGSVAPDDINSTDWFHIGPGVFVAAHGSVAPDDTALTSVQIAQCLVQIPQGITAW